MAEPVTVDLCGIAKSGCPNSAHALTLLYGKNKELEIQFAAIPFKLTPEGLRVLLVTSRKTHR